MNVATKAVFGVISAVLFIGAACMLAATITLAWLNGTQRNPEGFVESSEVSMSTDGYALTSSDLDLGSLPDEWVPSSVVGAFQVRASSEGDSPLFVGVGPSQEVDDFLADVAHAEVTRFGNQQKISYDDHPGSAQPQRPTDVSIWTASAEGRGLQTLDWEPESGEWTLVVMNSDATSGLDISASLGVRTPWIAIGIWVIGMLTVLIAVGGVVMAILASKQPGKADVSDAGSPKSAPLSS